MMAMIAINSGIEEMLNKPKIPRRLNTFHLNSHTMEPVEIDNTRNHSDGNSAKPDEVTDGDNIGEGLAQLVAGLLFYEEVAGVEDELEGGAAGLLLLPAAQDAGCQPIVLVHNPVDSDENDFGTEYVVLNT